MDNYVIYEMFDKQFFMKSSKVNYQSTNTSLASICSLVSYDVDYQEKEILHNQYELEDCKFIEGGYLEDEEEQIQPEKLHYGLNQIGIDYEEEQKSDLCEHKNERRLTDLLDFSFFLPKQVDVSLENQANNIKDRLYFLENSLPEEELFQQISDYECKIKQECQFQGQKKELSIQNVFDKIEHLQKGQDQSENEDILIVGRKIKKNVNMPKAIARYLMKYYKKYEKSLFGQYNELFAQLQKDAKQFKNWKRKDKNNCFKLNHLAFFFSDRNRKKLTCLNRLMMRKILSKNTRNEIISSNQVKDKLEYLVASKVYSIRCANYRLATRMQMR